MAMKQRTASPWWASLVYLIGLLLLFIGQRAFYAMETLSLVTTSIGALFVIGITGARIWSTVGSRGGRRRVERSLLMCHLGAGLALVLYACTTHRGMSALGVASMEGKSLAHFQGALTALWCIALAASLIPLFMIELSLGTTMRGGFDVRGDDRKDVHADDAVEYFRVREIGIAGLSIALGAAFLMVTVQVVGSKNVRHDVSYFKTSAPGESTTNIVNSSDEHFKVLLFFPDVNEVKDEVAAYFTSLAKATGKIDIEPHDRMVDAELAAQYKVQKDGVVVIVRGDKSEQLEVDTNIDVARRGKSKLRNLDREVNTHLLKLMREKKKAYLTVGHGEINDPDSIAPELRGKVPLRHVTALKKRLADLNYEVKDLGLVDLAVDVPADATVVLMLGPAQALAPEELAALDRYAAKGGRLLVALDPKGEAVLGPLEGRLGVTFDKGSITDDKVYLRQRGNDSDHRWAVTTQFSAHASTTTLSRSVDKGLLLIDAGVLKDHPFAADAAGSQRTYVIRSMPSSWQDFNDNFQFDEATEKRDRYNIGAAIEGPAPKDAPKDASKPDPKKKDAKTDNGAFRAMVFSDADLFADLGLSEMGGMTVIMVSGPLLDDAMKWLGGDEVFSGDVVNEEDVAISHTKNKDAAWFLVTIIGAPMLVLAIGLISTTMGKKNRRKKKRSSKTAEVMS